MGLLKTILIIALVYYGIKIISRIFAPLLLKFAAKKAEERFGGQFGQFQKRQSQQTEKKEGEITIDKIPETKTSNKNVGEYVDYEEIE
ncbi:DUF4834 family protein [Algibacter pectinivorans]|uniref:DUF4834 domain-containing protein n=1 Tax=Algibacter pectinivorans TaxID=870482 RepID=A0A1I1PAY9_9FLAO|nr:DUF4834 family protein [Algibacter pectinivorans]SFD07101.1 protein of unknown function [Algibacter pectinivorans]